MTLLRIEIDIPFFSLQYPKQVPEAEASMDERAIARLKVLLQPGIQRSNFEETRETENEGVAPLLRLDR
jgi:hypothetical protein